MNILPRPSLRRRVGGSSFTAPRFEALEPRAHLTAITTPYAVTDPFDPFASLNEPASSPIPFWIDGNRSGIIATLGNSSGSSLDLFGKIIDTSGATLPAPTWTPRENYGNQAASDAARLGKDLFVVLHTGNVSGELNDFNLVASTFTTQYGVSLREVPIITRPDNSAGLLGSLSAGSLVNTQIKAGRLGPVHIADQAANTVISSESAAGAVSIRQLTDSTLNIAAGLASFYSSQSVSQSKFIVTGGIGVMSLTDVLPGTVISASRIGSLITRPAAKSATTPARAGDFSGDLSLTGAGLIPGALLLGPVSIAGKFSDSIWRINGGAATIQVAAVSNVTLFAGIQDDFPPRPRSQRSWPDLRNTQANTPPSPASPSQAPAGPRQRAAHRHRRHRKHRPAPARNRLRRTSVWHRRLGSHPKLHPA